jgi:hypothetical protein
MGEVLCVSMRLGRLPLACQLPELMSWKFGHVVCM